MGCPLSCPAKAKPPLVGPNGAGKSTLVAALLGLLPHQGGTVADSIGARCLARWAQLPPFRRVKIAYVPQALSLQGQFPLSGGVRGFFGFDRRGPTCLGVKLANVSAPGGAPLLVAVLAAALGSRFAQRAVRRANSKRVLLSSGWVRPRRCCLDLRLRPAWMQPSAARSSCLLGSFSSSEAGLLHVSHDLEHGATQAAIRFCV